MSLGPGHDAQDRHALKIGHSIILVVTCAARRIVMAARRLRNTRVISAGAEQDGQPDAERGRDQQVDVDARVAARDQQHRDRRDDDREQRQQP